MSSVSVDDLKQLFAKHLCDADLLKRPEGIATGLESLDRYLVWGGLPKGALTLLCGSLGTGSTSLWLEAADRSIQAKRWVAWVNRDVPLAPLSLQHRGMDLGHFVAIDSPAHLPKGDTKLFWLLQELMSSHLFELIGCDLGTMRLREHQLRKLQAQARDSGVALVFLTQGRPYRGPSASVFSLVLSFEKRRISIERALHRPTPHSFARSVTYARFTLHTGDRIGSGSHTADRSPDSTKREPSSLPQTSRAALKRL